MKRVAHEYKQNLSYLTESYAKFKASADAGGLSIASQQQIFESVTRALTAFGVSGQEANLAMKGIQQMMSKGKVSAEELRRQLGEQLPIAMEAMARALGVSMGEMEELLKKGEVYSAEVLPKFAEELNKMVTAVDTDNLETSFAQIGNTLIEIVEEWGLVEKFKAIVDGTVKALQYLKGHAVSIVATIGAFFAGLKVPAFASKFVGQAQMVETAEKKLEASKVRLTVQYERLEKARRKLAAARQAEASDVALLKKKYEAERSRAQVLYQSRAQAGADLIQAKNIKTWGVIKTNALGAIRAIGGAFKGILSASIYGLIFAAIAQIVSKVVEWVSYQRRVNNLVRDYREGIKNIDYGQQVSDLQNLRKLVEDQNAKEEDKKGLLAQINKEYGYSLELNQDLSKQLERQIGLLKQQEQLRYHREKSYETTKRQEEILGYFNISDDTKAPNSREKIIERLNYIGKLQVAGGQRNRMLSFEEADKISDFYSTQNWLLPVRSELVALGKEWYNLSEVSNLAYNEIAKLSKVEEDTTITFAPVKDTDKGKKESPLERAEREYAERVRELSNQKRLDLISEKEYQEELQEASRRATLEIGGLLGEKAKGNKTYREAEQHVVAGLTNEAKALEEAKASIVDHERRANTLHLTEEQKRKERIEALNTAIDRLLREEEQTPAILSAIRGYERERNNLLPVPQKGERDTAFDYKKGEDDITREEIQLLEEYVQQLKALQEAGLNVADAINKAQSEISTLQGALRLQELKRDVADFNRELSETTYSSIKNIAGSTQYLVHAFKSMRSAFTDDDASPFERLLNVFNALQQAVDGVLSTIQMFEKIGEASKKLGLASQAVDLLTSKQEGMAGVAEGVEDGITGVAQAQGNAVGEAVSGAGKEVASSKAVTKAKIEEATAKILAANAALGPAGAMKAGAEIALW
ncbi:tape measure protein [Porphyromonas gingivicanis]|uniref:tape measure protein n=1 Tax=Porphyromonas gingivicanis TaxID=266762 RepID=UPI000472659B|nr:tape measure protein [Porphyromonas gingivicanis]